MAVHTHFTTNVSQMHYDGYIIVSEVYITITFDSLSMSIDASLDNIHAPC